MTRELIHGVSVAIDDEFNADGTPEYRIYDSEIRQGINEPAFHIRCLDSAEERVIGPRHIKRLNMVVQYFPSEAEDYQEECCRVGERLFRTLGDITCIGEDRPLHGRDMRFETVDGVLNFFVGYDFYVKEVTDAADMETMELMNTARCKGGAFGE